MARVSINCFFTDNEFSFIEKPDGYNMKKLKYSSVKLPAGTIENGIIYNEEQLIRIIKDTFKLFKIKSRKVNLIIHEELFTFRKIDVPIIHKPQEIGEYIKGEIGKSIMIPYDEMKMDYVIHTKTEDKYEVILFYAPNVELKQYVNLFYQMNMMVVRTDIPPLALHRLYYYRKYEDSDLKFQSNIMLVAIFDDTYSIYIFDQEIPIFSLVQNLTIDNITGDKYMSILDQEISKISNYFKFNINSGDQDIEKAVLFNMSNKLTNPDLEEYFNEDDAEAFIEVFNMKNTSKIVDTLIDRECYIPLAASLVQSKGLW